ncbi:MAG: hypothetical protein LCH37_05845 [Bacteroidetes bacterium]|nr:hypothetical protein [Bacteroidota bacterium]MCK6611866.1 hypothetical protein [Bacteroidia bacterium]
MAFGDGLDGVDDLKFWAICFWLLALGFGFRGRLNLMNYGDGFWRWLGWCGRFEILGHLLLAVGPWLWISRTIEFDELWRWLLAMARMAWTI